LPSWYNTENIIYPSKISLEQTSSEKTALYKSELVSGETLIDLTGGFGVDDFYFSKKVHQVTHCEVNEVLSEIVNHNFKQLKIENIQCIAGDSCKILENLNQKFDWIYIDPSRRNDAKGKVFMLKDCLPNVPENIDYYFNYSDNILIKTAPILDLTAGMGELKNIAEIHIIALENEVKELLWVLKKNHTAPIAIKTCNISKNGNEYFSFAWDEWHVEVSYGYPKKYIYEPNAAIMKSGGFQVVADKFKINKLHPHSHLYTSENWIDFPGRAFELIHFIPYNKNEMKATLENKKANITTRNFPDSVESLRKKWKIKEGGEQYCFFTTNMNNDKIVLLCNKLK